MSLRKSETKSELIPILERSKNLAALRKSSQTFLENKYLVGRTFNAFPKLVTKEQVDLLKLIWDGIKRLWDGVKYINPTSDIPERPVYLVDLRDIESLEYWFKLVAREACSQLLDGFGQIKWALIHLLGWENSKNCYTEQEIRRLIYSYVNTILQQALQQLSEIINQKPAIFLSAFGKSFNDNADDWVKAVLKETQRPDTRSRDEILTCFETEYKNTKINRYSHPDETSILKEGLANKKSELPELFSFMLRICEANGIAQGSLAQLLKHYLNKLHINPHCCFKSSTLIMQRSLKVATPKLAELKIPPPVPPSAEIKPEARSAVDTVEEDLKSYEMIDIEDALDPESTFSKMMSIAYWMRLFESPKFPESEEMGFVFISIKAKD